MLAGIRSPASHVWLAQDDYIPCKNIVPTIMKLIAARPRAVLLLATTRLVTGPTLQSGKHWYVTRDGVSGGAFIWPVDLLKELLEWSAAHMVASYPHDDGRAVLFALARGFKFFGTAPSLIQHTMPHGSLMAGHNSYNSRRVMSDFIGLNTDPVDVDWTKGLADPFEDRAATWIRKHVRLYVKNPVQAGLGAWA
jgi:hypothetical protein